MNRSRLFLTLVAIAFATPGLAPQARRAPSSVPQIDVEHYAIQVTLNPDSHEVKATAVITFRPIETTDIIVFDLSENLSVQKVLNDQGVEIDFGQDEAGPGILTVRFGKPIPAGASTKVSVEYSGGFDKDRFSRQFSRDESSAYIGMDGTYLLYSSKWFPVNRFLVDRATAEIRVTVPLGMTAVGPGKQLPVVTKGIMEQFGWSATNPILPNSIVAGRYFEKAVQSGNFAIDCFAREDHIDAIQKSAEELAKILEYYSRTFGPSAANDSYRLVEVDDRLEMQPGNLGTIFVTHRELSQNTPAVRQLARRAAYQWWQETVGVRTTDDLWLADGLSYYSAALYLGSSGGPSAFREEINNLAVLGLKFEGKSAVRAGLGLGFRSEGYESVVGGKGAWIFNMLRSILGDVKFQSLLQEYGKNFSAKSASSADFQKLSEKIHGDELGWFFAEWLDTIGVPELQSDFLVYKTAEGFRVSGTIKQDRDLFRMPLDVEVVTRGKPERARVELNGKSSPFDINTFAWPSKVTLDPDNRIFRNSRELQVAVQLSLANDLKQKGSFVEAVHAYEQALKLNPRKSMAHYRLAETLFEQSNLQSSANSFRDSLNGDKDPAWIEVWSYIYLGKIYDILSQRQRALAEYNKGVNTKDDTFGAQAEAQKWIATPFTRERITADRESKPPQQ